MHRITARHGEGEILKFDSKRISQKKLPVKPDSISGGSPPPLGVLALLFAIPKNEKGVRQNPSGRQHKETILLASGHESDLAMAHGHLSVSRIHNKNEHRKQEPKHSPCMLES
jgi:hypothetical protein